MKATKAKLLAFLQKSPRFVIPIYQRTYSWTEKQCRQLWDEILRAGSSDTVAVHFIGSIVYIEQGRAQRSHDPAQKLYSATRRFCAECFASVLEPTKCDLEKLEELC